MFDEKWKNAACEATHESIHFKQASGRTREVVCGSMHKNWCSGLSVARCSLATAAPH